MTTIAIVVLAAWVLAAEVESWFAHKTLGRERSKWFIERQQLQGKVDTLTEVLLQRAGWPVDLSKPTRAEFQERVKNSFAAPGWKTDRPATPRQG